LPQFALGEPHNRDRLSAPISEAAAKYGSLAFAKLMCNSPAVIVIQISKDVAQELGEVHPLGVLFSSLLLGSGGGKPLLSRMLTGPKSLRIFQAIQPH
jgi:hypothetical protein